MERKIITALASFGMSGKVFHAPLLSCHSGFQLKTIVERTMNEAKSIYPDVHLARSFNELLLDKEIELIIVNTPDNTHNEFAHKAIKAGKHVLVEKPFTQRAGEGEDLLNFAIRNKRLLTVFQNRRWDGDFLTVQKVIKDGTLGQLVEFEAHFDRFKNFIQENTWKENSSSGTGTLYNLGSHLIDQALVLFGMPNAITADIRKLRPGSQIDDFFEVIMHYKTKRVAVRATYLAKEPSPRFMLHGTKGSFVKYGLDTQEDALKQGVLPNSPNWGKDPEELWGTLNTENYRGKIETIPGNYSAFYDNLYDAIVNGKELAVKPQDAIQTIKVIEAAMESSENHTTVEI
jgi:scyllo-inositol 2-dehydrogenase (NADP+)